MTFHGYVEDRDLLSRRIGAADVALSVCPGETFGLAVLEALACGTPVVTADRGGARELVDGSVRCLGRARAGAPSRTPCSRWRRGRWAPGAPPPGTAPSSSPGRDGRPDARRARRRAGRAASHGVGVRRMERVPPCSPTLSPMGLLTPVAIRIGPLLWMPKLLPQIVWMDKNLPRVTQGRVTILDIAGLPGIYLTVRGRKSASTHLPAHVRPRRQHLADRRLLFRRSQDPAVGRRPPRRRG